MTNRKIAVRTTSATPKTEENILAASPEARGTDANGNSLETNGKNVTVSKDGVYLTVVIPVRLAKGRTLGTFIDPNGLTFQSNTLTIPGDVAAACDYGIRVSSGEDVLPSLLIVKTSGAFGTGNSAEARVISITASTGFTPDGKLPDGAAGAIELELNRLPRAAAITITALEADAAVTAALERAAASAGMENTAIAYSIRIDKTDIENGTDIKSAIIFMKTGIDWVSSHGGPDVISIARYDAETGRSQVLETVYMGLDEQYRGIFRGISPDGLSVFGLLGRVVETAEPAAPESPPALEPPEDTRKPAAFTVSNLEVTPSRAQAGATVNMSADVTNTGGMAGTYNVVLKMDGVAEASREVFLGAGAGQKVTFSIIRYAAGTYVVDIDGLVGSFEIPPEESPEESAAVKPSNWKLLAGIVAAIIFVICLMAYISRRQARPAE